jgi:iron complex outermembrane receptor protein
MTALALILASGFSLADESEEVLVTATRFSQANPRLAANASVITREDIRTSPAASLPELLRSRAGVEVRGLYGPLGIDATVDLRGFGEGAGSNTLILLDGQRLNPIDSGAINWSAVPLESIERIEIIRGGGTVLYGDRASGGVVNIVTDRSGRRRLSAEAMLGDFGYRGVQAHAAGGGNGASFNLFGQYRETDGFRRNSQQDQRAASGRVGMELAGRGELFADFAAYGDSNGLPGALFRAQYESDPSQARFLRDYQNREGYRVRPGVALDVTPTLRLEAELAADHARLRSFIPSGQYQDERDRDLDSLTPRLRWRHGLGSLPSETVVGADFYHGETEIASLSGFAGANRQRAEQRSRAWYVQNITEPAPGLALTLGARAQRVRQEAADQAAGLSGDTTRTRHAGEIGLAWQALPDLRLYAKAGGVFRFANTDELFGFDPVTFLPLFRGDLRPQHGTSRELGADWRVGPARLKATLYRLDLRDEIGFNAATFANENLPRTRRNGAELEGRWQPAAAWRLHASYTYQDPQFREGPDAGKTIPLAARHKGSVGATWFGGGWGTHGLTATYVGKRWYAGDTANVREQLPGYALLDYQASWSLARWTLTLKVLNAFNKRYAPYAGYSTFFNDYFYYPADPRSVFVGVRYDLQ